MPISLLSENDFKPRSFTEAKAKLLRKAPLTSAEFDRLSVKNRANAFRVATVQNARIVQQLRNTITEAIDAGTDWRTVRQEMLKQFASAGIPPAPLTRLRFAFLEQTRQAYSDARVEQLDDEENLGAFPFRMYLTVGNGTPGFAGVRPDHAALHRKVFASDDPAWDVFTPPWDYGCRCSVIPLTEGMVRRGRMIVWTYSGGAIHPTEGPKEKTAKRIKLKPNPDYSRSRKSLDLSELDADLRRIVKERLN